ncbi:endoplasmic reticulum transport protein [Theileria orientalis]|uniref:Endoplasmic reticulum transport protein n=1 Tax=Theileria orientalis TaxID=68886 RepID=A0A976SL59_THEOR|nr:endoplasmic reticulum transport protein [Theileria orientalis]
MDNPDLHNSSNTDPNVHSKILVFIIVGKDDKPLLIEDLSTPGRRSDPPHLASFVAHQSLDVIDDLVWSNPNFFLKQVDVFDFLSVSAYVTCSHVSFILITRAHVSNTSDFVIYSPNLSSNEPDPPSMDSVRSFFKEVHELYSRQVMNPLYVFNGSLESNNFKNKVRQAAKKHLI